MLTGIMTGIIGTKIRKNCTLLNRETYKFIGQFYTNKGGRKMAKENKKINNEELEKEKMGNTEPEDETKGNEPEDQGEDQDDGAENPPAKVDKPKKKNILEKVGDKINELKDEENHPIASKVISTGGKVAKGLPWAIGGAVAAVGTMAYVAKKTIDASNSEDDDVEDDDEDIIDSEATELDDSEI